jgi:F-type H+-transporting ATPase subunit a
MLNRIEIKRFWLIPFFSLGFLFSPIIASDESHNTDQHDENTAHDKEFVAGEFILDHLADSHEWHLWTNSDGHHVSVPLPVILYSKNSGWNFFMSGKLAHGHVYNQFMIAHDGEYKGKIIEVDMHGEFKAMPLDLSITKTVAGMIFSAIFILLLFVKMGSVYRKEKNIIPKGINGFLEPMILFIRDDIAIPNIGNEKYERFMPYLLTVFFFILVNNLMGLLPPFIPFGANVTGNIAITMVLAIFTFTITQISGTKNYWKHIVATPGVPWWLSFVMIPVEIIGMFSKPFALMIRLFANITAGHIIVLSLISLIFIFKSLAIAPVSIAFVLFMDIT